MLQCICCIIFRVCHKHNSLPSGQIQPSSPSTMELHGLTESGPEPKKSAKKWFFVSSSSSRIMLNSFERYSEQKTKMMKNLPKTEKCIPRLQFNFASRTHNLKKISGTRIGKFSRFGKISENLAIF